MNTKNFLSVLVIFSLLLWISSCKDDDNDTEKPVITNLEVGHNDTLYVGKNVHLEFEVTDNERLSYYRVLIHEEGHHKSALLEDGWEYDSTFTEISGLKSHVAHHHKIKVPDEGVHLGEYHFELLVFDESGNFASDEREVIVAESDGDGDGDGDHHSH